jgi:serine/threonine protein kinase
VKEPRRIGPYYLLDRIAQGGMAEVYWGKKTGAVDFARDVAIKLLLQEAIEDVNFVGMFIDEARTCSMLHHPHIAQVNDFGEANGKYFMVMEYIAGQNLRTVIKRAQERRQPLPIGLAVYIGMCVCEALEYAHAKCDNNGSHLRLIHRDISPPNIIVSYEGEVKLIDFGIAKSEVQEEETEIGTVKGKYAYMSPEQAKSQTMDHRSDLFSLGIVLHELLTGESLFQSNSLLMTLNKVVEANVAPPSASRAGIPPALDKLVLRALSRSPADRFDTAGHMHGALTQILQQHFTSRRSLAQLMEQLFVEERQQEAQKVEYYANYFSQHSPHTPLPNSLGLSSPGHIAHTHEPQFDVRIDHQQQWTGFEEPRSYSGPFPHPSPTPLRTRIPTPEELRSYQEVAEVTSYVGPNPQQFSSHYAGPYHSQEALPTAWGQQQGHNPNWNAMMDGEGDDFDDEEATIFERPEETTRSIAMWVWVTLALALSIGGSVAAMALWKMTH